MAEGRSGLVLAAYLARQKIAGRARASRLLQRELSAGREDPDRAAERLGASDQPRPEGPLVWVHVGSGSEAMGLPELIERLDEERPDLNVLITTERPGPNEVLAARLPERVILQNAPYGIGPGPAGFLAHWRPEVMICAANNLDPVTIEAAAAAGVTQFMIDARVPPRPGWRWIPGIRRRLLKRFSHILAADERVRETLIGLGVEPDRIEATGFLQEGGAPLPCSQAERDSLAEVLAARPVWFAAGVTAEEVPLVVEAHRQAISRSHRLLCVLMPDELDDGPALAAQLEQEGWVVGLRSTDDEPEDDTEIFVIDLTEEDGLWYRLSPISLMGGSLIVGRGPGARNPYEAAALGSAVLYGPNTGLWRESYERLRDAHAARAVSDIESLTRAVDYLLSPDHAAEMAAAAWEVTTSGAEATDRIVALVLDALDARGL